jgi:hypothetical protein
LAVNERLVEKEWTDNFKLFHETKQIMKSQFVQNNKEMDVPPRNLCVTPHFRSVLYAAVAERFIKNLTLGYRSDTNPTGTTY